MYIFITVEIIIFFPFLTDLEIIRLGLDTIDVLNVCWLELLGLL